MRHEDAARRLCALAGVTIQIAQLQHIEATVDTWISRIRACMGEIVKVSASQLVGIGPMVLEQEREVFAKLSHIELLESESKNYTARIRRTVGDHASLAQLIDRQVRKASVVRQLLHLLSLNSIVEASRLGNSANAILEIGNGILELSSEWARITEQSEALMREIAGLVQRIDCLMRTFSEDGDDALCVAQIQTREGLGSLREAAEFASSQCKEIECGLAAMQMRSDGIAGGSDALEAAYAGIRALIEEMLEVKRQLEADPANTASEFDVTEAERQFSASYTTEVERQVLHAALRGTAPPVLQQSSQGHSVELF
jgi:hypothetical protein